jgi:hypothetical protein
MSNKNKAFTGLFGFGPICPGTSTSKRSTDDGGKICSGSMGEFKIDKNGNCDDDNGCSLALTGPVCPGASVGLKDRKGGGRICKGFMGDFKIDKNGNCDDDNGCSLAATGPICPGVSRGLKDLKGGHRQCKIPEVTLPGNKDKYQPFEIDQTGKCVDPNNCATSLTSVLKAGIAVGAKAIASGANAIANKVSGKKSSSRRKSMCYMRKQKGKTSKKRVCLNKSAVARLRRGARKGGLHSHK